MRTRKYSLVFEQQVTKGEVLPFSFTPESTDEEIVGILLSDGLSFSFGINNGTELVLNRMTAQNSLTTPPDNRLIDLTVPLHGNDIKGTIRVHKESQREEFMGRVYFLIQYQQ